MSGEVNSESLLYCVVLLEVEPQMIVATSRARVNAALGKTAATGRASRISSIAGWMRSFSTYSFPLESPSGSSALIVAPEPVLSGVGTTTLHSLLSGVPDSTALEVSASG